MTLNIKKCRETHLVAPYHSSNLWKKHLLTRHGVCRQWIMDRFCQVFHRPIGIWAWAKWDSKKCLFKRFGSEHVWETNTTTQFTAPSNGSLYPFMTYGCSMSQRTLASVIWNISATARPKRSDRSMQARCKWQHIFRIQFDFKNNYIPAPSSRGEMKTLPIPETLMS